MQSSKFCADVQLKNLISKCQQSGHRSLLFICNKEGKNENSVSGEQVMLVHHLICKVATERPSVLWCHKRNSTLPRPKKRVLKELEKNLKSGNHQISPENAFPIFLLSTNVKFCPYEETQSVLGNTFGMCVIQDFEGLTPNILCRVTETVKGGGAIIFLLPAIASLRELFNLEMDVHNKLKTSSHPIVCNHFNERFVLSSAWCESCLVLDEKLQVCHELALQKAIKSIGTGETNGDEGENALKELLESLSDAEKPLPQLCKLCCTFDQAKAVLKLIDVLTEKSGRSTVSITSGRGRGKSAALGISVAAAIYFGVNNIYIVSPTPENLGTFFECLFKGFDALDYEESTHYEIIQSTNPEFKESIVQVKVFARHRQVIQYLHPSDKKKVQHAELVVIDEAASIPIVHIKALLGFHNVFMASTVNGYEGTGRSLSLKLLQQLRRQSVPVGANAVVTKSEESAQANCRPLHEISLETSIRYKANDPVEKWINRLLCLEATSYNPVINNCPPPSECELYYVNREVLFSGHKETEKFLNQIISLLVASHYRNSPDDLQILCDAPAHHLFVLLLPLPAGGSSSLPTVFSVLQVSLEGGISSKVSEPMLSQGESGNGDLIPWTLASKYSTPKLTKLKGVRIIRAATHPDLQSMGYGSRAVQLLTSYYKGRFISLDEKENVSLGENTMEDSELIEPRKTNKPLMMKLSERNPDRADYIGVSYGLTKQLFKFWNKLDFIPLYISQNINKITAEHNCIMVQPLSDDFNTSSDGGSLPRWMVGPAAKFFEKITHLLGTECNDLPPDLALNILSSHEPFINAQEIEWRELECIVNGPYLKRLETYSKNLSDRHHITDLIIQIAPLYFNRKLPSVHLSPSQAGLLVGCGLQDNIIEDVAQQLDIPIVSALGLFNRAIRRLHKAMSEIQEKCIMKTLPDNVLNSSTFNPVSISLDQDLQETGEEYDRSMEPKISSDLGDLSQYVIKGDEADWSNALKNSNQDIVTLKRQVKPPRMTEKEYENELNEPIKKKKKNNSFEKTSFKNKGKKPFKRN